ncbi:hypothetical protein WQQ_40140 [Hydrocarboniphaga effusa AP103]|uniref:Uncharacterized protein n=1 Tax=Hydrocarboniphaga effusa AP103 TaxID=1172194 RepID=I7Z724_9GAMM|nr:hypothetical protein WQQ_40140 [Hydrocarboniphaga effusa AP103]
MSFEHGGSSPPGGFEFCVSHRPRILSVANDSILSGMERACIIAFALHRRQQHAMGSWRMDAHAIRRARPKRLRDDSAPGSTYTPADCLLFR